MYAPLKECLIWSMYFQRYVQGAQIRASQGFTQCDKVVPESIPHGGTFI